jgi:DNA-binding MarR family transcriptional regulator
MADNSPIELPDYGVGFLLSTLGFRSHAVWAERLAPLGLDNRQAAMLLQVAAGEGQPQLAFARALTIPPSRIVALVDDLERRRLLERRSDPADRRVRTLHVTAEGREMVRRLGDVARAHEDGLCVGLDVGERGQLVALLRKAAAGLGVSTTVHAGLGGGEWRQRSAHIARCYRPSYKYSWGQAAASVR